MTSRSRQAAYSSLRIKCSLGNPGRLSQNNETGSVGRQKQFHHDSGEKKTKSDHKKL